MSTSIVTVARSTPIPASATVRMIRLSIGTCVAPLAGERLLMVGARLSISKFAVTVKSAVILVSVRGLSVEASDQLMKS